MRSERVQTNIVIFTLKGEAVRRSLCAAEGARGCLASAIGPDQVRLVTHSM